jgi:hypothetical protein
MINAPDAWHKAQSESFRNPPPGSRNPGKSVTDLDTGSSLFAMCGMMVAAILKLLQYLLELPTGQSQRIFDLLISHLFLRLFPITICTSDEIL